MKSLIYIFILIPAFLLSQDKEFSISVNRDTLLFGNSIKVEFSVKNIQGDFEGPAFENFDVIMGPSTSSSYSNINGKVTNSSKYTYLIKPKSEGEFFIENAFILQGDSQEELQTEPVKIVVLPNPDGLIDEESNPYMNSQFFNFSWPSDSEAKPQNPIDSEIPASNNKNKRKIKKI